MTKRSRDVTLQRIVKGGCTTSISRPPLAPHGCKRAGRGRRGEGGRQHKRRDEGLHEVWFVEGLNPCVVFDLTRIPYTYPARKTPVSERLDAVGVFDFVHSVFSHVRHVERSAYCTCTVLLLVFSLSFTVFQGLNDAFLLSVTVTSFYRTIAVIAWDVQLPLAATFLFLSIVQLISFLSKCAGACSISFLSQSPSPEMMVQRLTCK